MAWELQPSVSLGGSLPHYFRWWHSTSIYRIQWNFVCCTSKITNIEVDLIRALLLFVGVIGVLVGLLSLSKTLRGTIGGKNNVGKEPRMLEVLPTQFTLAVENIDPT